MSDYTPSWENSDKSNKGDYTPSWEAQSASVSQPEELKPVGRGQLPIPNSKQEPLSSQNMTDALMLIPAAGVEAGVLRGGTALEDIITRASPDIAQTVSKGLGKAASTITKTGAAGAAGGATYGETTGRDVESSAAMGAVGALGGQAVGYAGSKGYQAAKNYLSRNIPEAANNQAVKAILNKFQKDVKGGGVSAEQAIQLIDEARKGGKEMILPDVAGANVKGLAGSVARVPGPGKEQAQQFLNTRDSAASKRLLADTNKHLSTESGKRQQRLLLRYDLQKDALYSKKLMQEALWPLCKTNSRNIS